MGLEILKIISGAVRATNALKQFLVFAVQCEWNSDVV